MSVHYETNRSLRPESRLQRDQEAHFGPGARHDGGTPRDAGDVAWGDDAPNPFALVMQAHEPSAKSRFVRAMKTMAVTLVLTAVLLGGVFLGKQFLLARLVADFDDLPPAARQARLVQIASFGVDAVEPLVSKLLDQNDEVSETAFSLLRQMQKDWVTLSPRAAGDIHARVIAAIDHNYRPSLAAPPSQQDPSELSEKQLARARELVRQTVLEFSPSSQNEVPATTELQQLLAGANRLLADLDTRSAATPTLVTAGGKLDPRGETLDVSAAARRSGWTDWPPPTRPATAQIVRSRQAVGIAAPTEMETDREQVAEASDADLQSLPEGVTAPLSQLTPGHAVENAAIVAARRPLGRVIKTTTHLVDSPLAALNDETVIRHLANPDAMLAGRARAELIQRGFSERQLETATALAVAGPEDRIGLVDSLVHSSDMNSGPWLSMLLDDPDRRVRLRVVATLAQSQDAAVLQRLRERLAREDDAHVAARLRRILGYR